MIQAYNHNGRGGHMIAVQNVMPEDVDKYGIIDTGGPVDDRATVDIHGLVEKPAPADAPSTLAVIGRYIPIGRAACRGMLCQYVWITVVAVTLKKKKTY